MSQYFYISLTGYDHQSLLHIHNSWKVRCSSSFIIDNDELVHSVC